MECIVKELNPEMAARGGAALSQASLVDLGLEEDECISITGDGGIYAFARVRRGSNVDGALPSIAVDAYLRGQLGISPGDRVEVEPAAVAEADVAELTIPDVVFFQGPTVGIHELLRSRLLNRPLTEGRPTMIAVSTDDDEVEQHFPVRPTSLRPAGPAVVTEETEIRIDQEAYIWTPHSVSTQEEVSFADIGGLTEELEQIREVVELPMQHPELFTRLDIDPPSGVLLHGPPGTGKTLIARATANELDATFIHLDGPEIEGPLRGMAETALRDTFERAREESPAIIFIDEIDAIAPARGSHGTIHSDNTTVAQLLTLMDGLEESEDVVVVGATNRVDAIDPALRRSGRFDRELEIGVPGETAREDILEIHTRNVPLSPAVDLGDYAARTHGFVGADLAMFVTEAGLNAIDRLLPHLDLGDEPLSETVLDQIEVTVADMDQALTEVEPSALREHVVEVPSVTWDDVGGLDDVQTQLEEVVQWPLSYSAAFRTLDVEPASGVLLHGPPGTGKTLLARAAANEIGSNFISVKGPELFNKYVGGSEANVRELFETARTNAPCIVLFDEIDAIAASRDGTEFDSGISDRVVSQLLTELDGIDTLENVFVIATTNRPDLIDDALLRPGRLDYQLQVPLPDAEARREIFDVHLRDKPIAGSVDIGAFVVRSDGYSGAEITAICREAALAAFREVVERVPSEDVEDAVESTTLSERHFEEGFDLLKSDNDTDESTPMTY